MGGGQCTHRLFNAHAHTLHITQHTTHNHGFISTLHPSLGPPSQHLLLVGLELRGGCLLQRTRQPRDGVVVGAALGG
jgi:hypothetical protein